MKLKLLPDSELYMSRCPDWKSSSQRFKKKSSLKTLAMLFSIEAVPFFKLKRMKNFIQQREQTNHTPKGLGDFTLLEKNSSSGTPEQAP